MNKGVFMALVYFAALAGVVALMLFLLSPFLSSIAWAGVLALGAYPIRTWCCRRCRGRQNLGAFLATAVVTLIIVVPLLVILVLFASQATQVVGALQQAEASGHIPGREEILANPHVAELMTKLEPYLKGVDLKPVLFNAMKAVTALLVGTSKKFVLGAIAALFKFFIMIAVLFFAFRDGQKMTTAFWEMVPLKQEDKAVIVGAVRRVVSAVLYGIVLTCIVQGILGGVGFAIVGLPSPVFFGAVMVITAFIPVVGTALVWVPGALYLLAMGEMGKAAILALWGLAVVSSIDNFIRPYFISGKSKVPLLVVLLGVLGGLATMGFLGIIVGPLLFTVSLEVFQVYRREIFPGLMPSSDAGAKGAGEPPD